MNLFVQIMVTSFVGTWVSENLGPTAMFVMFGSTTFLGVIYIYFMVQDTTYVIE